MWRHRAESNRRSALCRRAPRRSATVSSRVDRGLREGSNLCARVRSPLLCPLSYGGRQSVASGRVGNQHLRQIEPGSEATLQGSSRDEHPRERMLILRKQDSADGGSRTLMGLARRRLRPVRMPVSPHPRVTGLVGPSCGCLGRPIRESIALRATALPVDRAPLGRRGTGSPRAEPVAFKLRKTLGKPASRRANPATFDTSAA